MTLYILRHGLAAEKDPAVYPRDSERPLTAKGERKLRDVGGAMKALKLSFDRILSSPYVRARRTAEIVAAILHQRKKLEFGDVLKPSGTSTEVVQFLKTLSPAPASVLLVGHEPNLSQLICFLLTGEPLSFVVMKKGGLCKLSIESLQAGRCATLEWLLTPKQMAVMSK
jgi:phosphohistidine phosphatase